MYHAIHLIPKVQRKHTYYYTELIQNVFQDIRMENMEESDSNNEFYADVKDTRELRNVLYGFEKESWNYLNMLEWLKDEMEKAWKLKKSWDEDTKTIPIIPNDENRASEFAIPSVINLLKFFQFQPPEHNRSEYQQYLTIPKRIF